MTDCCLPVGLMFILVCSQDKMNKSDFVRNRFRRKTPKSTGKKSNKAKNHGCPLRHLSGLFLIPKIKLDSFREKLQNLKNALDMNSHLRTVAS